MDDAAGAAEHPRQHLVRLEWQLAQLPASTQRVALLLEQRPDIARLLGSRFGVFAMAVLQHSIWAVRHRMGRLRASVRRAPVPPVVQPPGEVATQTVAAEDAAPAASPFTPAPAIAALDTVPSGPRLSDIPFASTILHRRPRILIDITPTAGLPPFTGGIARVARSLAAAGVRTGLALPVHMVGGTLRSYYRHPLLEAPIVPGPDDIYVVLDVFWNVMGDYLPIVAQVKAVGGRVAVVVHDIGMIRFPALFCEDWLGPFRLGLLNMLQHADFCLGVSRHVEHDLRAWLTEIGFPRLKLLAFANVRLGVTKAPVGTAGLRRMITETFDGGSTFLAVGTLEPRKGYGITLDGCELAWASGAAFALVLMGRYGWSAEALRTRLEAHPEFGRRLFWFPDATDAELAHAYANCRSLIQSSLDEGFCLPVSEACLFGAAVITSDLPAIREIAGPGVTYYDTGSAGQLAARIHEALAREPVPADFPVRSWDESMMGLAETLIGRLAAGLPAAALHGTGAPPIHVACCFSEAYVMPAGVMAASVAATTHDAPVLFHMLHSAGLEPQLEALRVALERPGFRIVSHVLDGEAPGDGSDHTLGPAVYYRHMIPDVVDADRVIYLDGDTMARRSLSALWALHLEGHPIAATVDFLGLSHLNGDRIPVLHDGVVVTVPEYCREVVGIDLDTTPYFNSGVMLMDLDAWRRTGLAARCRAECQDGRAFNFVDQDAANRVLRGDFLALDQRWNAFVYLERAYRPEAGTTGSIMGGYEPNLLPPSGELAAAMRDWARDPWIVHFTHCSKPWRPEDRRTAFDDEFWQNAFRTPFGAALHLRFLERQEAARAHLEWLRNQ